MKRARLPVVLLLVALVLPSVALAKGASEATIVGPGLDGPIVLGAPGELGSDVHLDRIAESSGFFAAIFGVEPGSLLAERPTGELGPRYTVTYTMPGPDNVEDKLVQELYPYADSVAVTYVEPGQRFWTTQQTRGGWYVATSSLLKEQLVASGLPPTEPALGDGGEGSFPWLVATLAALGVAIALGVVGVVVGRRRPRPVAA